MCIHPAAEPRAHPASRPPTHGRTDGQTDRPFSKNNVQQWDKETVTFMVETRIPSKEKEIRIDIVAMKQQKHALITHIT